MAKESLYGIGKEPVFRETFNSLQDMEHNGAQFVPNSYTLENGRLKLDSVLKFLRYPGIFLNSLTVRYRGIIEEPIGVRYIFDGRDENNFDYGFYAYIDSGVIFAPGGTIYINGVLGNTLDFGLETEITVVFDNIPRKIHSLNLLTRYTGAQSPLGEHELFEVYDHLLTAEEISNLYKNSRYRDIPSSPVFHLTAENGVIEEKLGNSFTNTDVEVVRDGLVYVPKFNGSTTNLNFGDTSFFGENFSISFWFKRGDVNMTYEPIIDKSIGNMTTISGRGMIVFFDLTTNSLRFRAKDVTTGESITLILGPDDPGIYNHYVITRTGSYFVSYQDNIETNSGIYSEGYDLEQSTNLVIGEWQDFYRHITGNLSDVRFYDKGLSREQVSQLYNSTKFKYIG